MQDQISDPLFILIQCIPATYRSKDLRAFFSTFLEAGGFICCHFQHRKESTFLPALAELRSTTASCLADVKHRCCVATVTEASAQRLTSVYNGKHWVDHQKGEPLPEVCRIERLISTIGSDGDVAYLPGSINWIRPPRPVTIPELKMAPDFNPPSKEIPQGNVGTPTLHFVDLIRQCKMPAGLIAKLGLIFPKAKGRRKYSSVPFDYGNVVEAPEDEPWDDDYYEDAVTATGAPLLGDEEFVEDQRLRRERYEAEDVNEGKRSDDEESEAAEEWDRVEALEDDVGCQERNSERLFEEEMEVIWDKGGPGIVWYTDAMYWDQVAGDFDAKTSDDVDVDMSVYEGGVGDAEARQRIEMKQSTRLREGRFEESRDGGPPLDDGSGGFIRPLAPRRRLAGNALAVARMLTRHGWRRGEGLGKAKQGIATPVKAEGQAGRNRKRGLGFHGTKLKPTPPNPVLDNDAGVFRRNDHYMVRYRDGISFHRASDAPPAPKLGVRLAKRAPVLVANYSDDEDYVPCGEPDPIVIS